MTLLLTVPKAPRCHAWVSQWLCSSPGLETCFYFKTHTIRRVFWLCCGDFSPDIRSAFQEFILLSQNFIWMKKHISLVRTI